MLGIIAVALALVQGTAQAQKPAQSYPDEIGMIYMGNSQALAAIRPRLLTKNAHIIEFLCSPAGARVAYLSVIPATEAIAQSVAIADTESGDSKVYYHTSGNPHEASCSLLGWSDDSAYFAFTTGGMATDPSEPGRQVYIDTAHVVDLVHGSVADVTLPLDQMIPPAGPNDPPQRFQGGYVWGAAWAPGFQELALVAHTSTLDGPGDFAVCLYDAGHKTCRLLFEQNNFLRLDGWVDSSHLSYQSHDKRFIYDLATGKSSPSAARPRLASPAGSSSTDTTVFGPNKERLTLTQTLQPYTDQGQIDGAATSIWLTRTGGPAKLSKMLIDTFLPSGPGVNEDAQFTPNAGFDRENTYHVVYLSEGDLKVVDILPRGATPGEKLAAGEKLTCEEEIPIAENDAKQVGLGIIQYVQDHNETWPDSGNFHDDVYPYIKSDAVFSSPNGVAFHYIEPKSPKLADMEVPADTPLGEFDLPCEKVVLYSDGHVKVQQNSPGSP
ncbi:MAG TPA: hypothetical protein VFW40_03250 [Capsulimonadaceae bacterium]|nr:hypothetical protein [Capsulimonadaceae bacterium]